MPAPRFAFPPARREPVICPPRRVHPAKGGAPCSRVSPQLLPPLTSPQLGGGSDSWPVRRQPLALGRPPPLRGPLGDVQTEASRTGTVGSRAPEAAFSGRGVQGRKSCPVSRAGERRGETGAREDDGVGSTACARHGDATRSSHLNGRDMGRRRAEKEGIAVSEAPFRTGLNIRLRPPFVCPHLGFFSFFLSRPYEIHLIKLQTPRSQYHNPSRPLGARTRSLPATRSNVRKGKPRTNKRLSSPSSLSLSHLTLLSFLPRFTFPSVTCGEYRVYLIILSFFEFPAQAAALYYHKQHRFRQQRHRPGKKDACRRHPG